MKKYILSIAFSFIFCLNAISQMHPLDRLRIESLKNQLPTSQNSVRVDILNDLAVEYSTKGRNFIDSIKYYIAEAHKLATSLGYRKGIAYATLMQADMEMYQLKNYEFAGQLQASALKIAEELKDNRLLGGVYFSIGSLQGYRNDSTCWTTWKKALQFIDKAGDKEGLAAGGAIMCNNYSLNGNFEEAFFYCQQCIENAPAKPVRNPSQAIGWTTLSYRKMAEMYQAAGEFGMALELLRKSLKIVEDKKIRYLGEKELIGEVFIKMGNADSALYYLNLESNINNLSTIPFLGIMYGEAYYLKKDYNKAKQLFNDAVDTLRIMRLKHYLPRGLVGLARTNAALSNVDEAMKAGKEAIIVAVTNNSKHFLKDGYEIVSELFYKSGRYDSAYIYLKKFMVLKELILNQQFLWKLNNYKTQVEKVKKEAEIGFLNKDNQLKQQKLKQQDFIKNSLIVGIFLLFLLGVFVFRNLLLKRKNDKLRLEKDFKLHELESEKKQAELHQKSVELEMQALRAQMNPHFIFNCLSSINRFIFKNDNKTASDYLTRFSRLIRMVLMHSQKKLIPLEDELEMLRLYLDLERLRFKDAFDYHITTTNAIENSSVFIPPLLLQPFCENAIWHGLMHKEGPGHLNIELNEDNGILNCIITDDGVGREKAEEFKSKSAEKEKSMGLKITKERLSLLNQGTTGGTFYEIEDVRNEQGEITGTRVQLKIKYKESIEEFV